MKLVPVIAQDVRTNSVLMLAWANAEALARTRATKRMHYWSRSRGKLWRKGEESGHEQKVVSLHWDCDRDTLLARVEQTGPACHRNTYTCFGARAFPAVDMISRLEAIVRDRKRRPRKGSYTNRLLADAALARDKVLEEASELCMAAKAGRRAEIVGEAADLFYHALVVLASRGVTLEEVKAELERRHEVQGPRSKVQSRTHGRR
jgi:phosphoribosyl-ATP pyrophosphohydrolase/phosphoribosyl-AMP cyclohydrolase